MILQLVKNMIYVFVNKVGVFLLCAFLTFAPLSAVLAQTVTYKPINEVFINADTDCSDNQCVYVDSEGYWFRTLYLGSVANYDFLTSYSANSATIEVLETIQVQGSLGVRPELESFGGTSATPVLSINTGDSLPQSTSFSAAIPRVIERLQVNDFDYTSTGANPTYTDYRISVTIDGLNIFENPPNQPLNIDLLGSTTPSDIFSAVSGGVTATSDTFTPLYAILGVPVSFVIGRSLLLFIRASV